MRSVPIIPALLFAGLWSSPALCDDISLSDLPPVLPDPSLATSVRLPATLTNAGAAQVGPSLSAASRAGNRTPCTGANPCAMATPAADQIMHRRPGKAISAQKSSINRTSCFLNAVAKSRMKF